MTHFSPQHVQALIKKHGIPAAEPIKAEHEGVANEVWFVGEVVVRINKDVDFESDVWTETIAVPSLVDCGILTPQLLAFDSDFDIVPRLVTIYERVPGQSLRRVEQLADPESIFRSLGERVREYHDRIKVVEDPEGKLDPPWVPNYASARTQLIEVDPETDTWLPPDLIFIANDPPLFTHQDLHPDNVLVHQDRLSAIIDWGDAGWGSRTSDMRYIPAQFMSDFLSGYGEIADQDRVNLIIHQVDQFAYAAKNHLAYGAYGDTTLANLRTLVRCLST